MKRLTYHLRSGPTVKRGCLPLLLLLTWFLSLTFLLVVQRLYLAYTDVRAVPQRQAAPPRHSMGKKDVVSSRVSATSDIVYQPSRHLQTLFLDQLENLTVVSRRLRRNTCKKGEEHPCFLRPCNVSFLPPEQRLRHMLGSQFPIEERYKRVIDGLTDHKTGPRDIVFITAASANHYREMHGLLKGLESLIFPRLLAEKRYSFKLLCYDLGLEKRQVDKLDSYGICTSIIRVPLQSLPDSFSMLGTCAWKPLLIKANVHMSRITVWMDASTRFRKGDINPLVKHTLTRGMFVSSTSWLMPAHLAEPALHYFGVNPCLLSGFNEMAGGFLAFRNDELFRQAVLGPWVGCAFSPRCLCPGDDCYARLKPCRDRSKPYSWCHRFDQAVLGLILVNLFDWRASDFYGKKMFSFSRKKFDDFPELQVEP